ncbi:MAG: 2-oxoacid:acceptor oxidoreductase family protein [Nitrospirota bacterium]
MLFFGRILAYAAILEDREVTWFPSYGGEMRGGTANCTVIISNDLIGSPLVLNPDILVVFNEASLQKFQPRLKDKGLLLFDSSLIKDPKLRNDVDIIGIPATDISSKIGNTKSSNMVLLGALIARTGLLKCTSLLEALENSVPEKRKKTIETNKRAIMEGLRFIEDKKG